MARRAAFPLWLAAGCLACSRAPDTENSCAGVVSSGLFNAATQESYLSLSPQQQRAIVAIVDLASTGPDASLGTGQLCSGAFIARDWVVTAAHCLAIVTPAVLLQPEDGGSPLALAVTAAVASPDRDLALLRVDMQVDSGTPGFEPLAAGGSGTVALDPGMVVEIAGSGLTEAHTAGQLRFLAEPVVSTDATTITVDGFGANGACNGDSGGPLLIRTTDGTPSVAGVLSLGSSTCLERDVYVRLDPVQAWIDAIAGTRLRTATACGTISREGRCLYGSAMWCDAGVIAADLCDASLRCGWDAMQGGFRCVASTADPCSGVDSVGACRDGTSLRCVDGGLVAADCGGCSSCRIDGVTGGPECVQGARDP